MNWHPIPRSLIILHLINVANVAAQQLLSLSIPVTSPQIVYSPFVCNESTALADPQSCAGAWRLSNSNRTISTTGPSSVSDNIIPQMFFEFQASTLFLTTVASSNASVNLTLSSGGVDTSTIFNSSHRAVSIVGLPQDQTTLLTITYISTAGSTTFSVNSLIISVPADKPINSLLPTPTLPPFSSLPTFISTTTGSSTNTAAATVITVTSNKRMIAQAVGITVGLGLGLTTLAVTVFYYWQSRKQRKLKDEQIISEWRVDR